jgi:hypothetical protein
VAYRGVFPDEWLDRLTVEERLPFWERYLSDNDTATVLAEIEGTVVGFVLLGAIETTHPGARSSPSISTLWSGGGESGGL